MKGNGNFSKIYTGFKRRVVLLVFLAILSNSRQATGYTAYVANFGGDEVLVIDTVTNTIIGNPIPVGMEPSGIAITPDRKFAYVTNQNSHDVYVIDTSTDLVVGAPIPVGMNPLGIAITSTGYAYVANTVSNTVSVIDTNLPNPMVVGAPIPVGISPVGVAITPNGFAYVTNQGAPASVSVINTNLPIPAVVATIVVGIGLNPTGVAITPNGAFAYVANQVGPASVSVIDTSFMPLPFVTATVALANTPFAVAMSPSGFAYVTRAGNSTISVIDTNLVVPAVIATVGVGASPFGVAITPDGGGAYVTSSGASNVTVFNSNMPIPTLVTTIPGFNSPFGIAIFSPPAAEPPVNLRGSQEKNDFGLVFERFNLLQWEASPSVDPPVAGYFVYRDGIKIATLDSSTFEYEDHNRPKGVATLYSITAFDADGEESTPLNISID